MSFPQSFIWPAYRFINWLPVQASNFTASPNSGYPVNTSSNAISITLPANPSFGTMVVLADYAGTWGTNIITLIPSNANLIAGINAATSISTSRLTTSLVYIDNKQGWLFFAP